MVVILLVGILPLVSHFETIKGRGDGASSSSSAAYGIATEWGVGR